MQLSAILVKRQHSSFFKSLVSTEIYWLQHYYIFWFKEKKRLYLKTHKQTKNPTNPRARVVYNIQKVQTTYWSVRSERACKLALANARLVSPTGLMPLISLPVLFRCLHWNVIFRSWWNVLNFNISNVSLCYFAVFLTSQFQLTFN